jgi:hypothetical protein
VPIDDRTSTQNYPKPNIANTLADDVGRLRTALDDIDADMAAKAPTASPTFTGTPAAPTAAADTNTTQVATTAYVVGQAGSTNPVMDGTATVGTSLRFSRQDHVHPSDTSRATSTHVHGNITNAGAIGSTANLPIITTTSGALTTGSFGTTANTFCQGNDARLSDTRTPTDGSVTTAKIADDQVTYAKIQNVSATDRLLGRSTAGSGDVEEITCTAAGRALLDDVDAAAQRTTLGLGTLATQSGTFSGTSSGTNTGDQTITLTGDVTGTGTGSFTTAIAAGVIVDADVNASAAIAGTKISPNFGSQAVSTTGTITGASLIPTSATVPTNGVFLPAANTVGIATNGSERMRIRSDGNIGIGGAGSATVALYNQGAISGGTTAYGNFTASTIQSDVTATAFANRTLIGTAAASFTLPTLYHYSAAITTLGAGSSITTQIGYFAESNLGTTSAAQITNVFGFRGEIASATGRWNFYASGTAPNYFAGDVRIGSIADTGNLLYVAGSARFNGQIEGIGADTAAAPGFTWDGDENTGMFRPAADTIGFSTAGTERMRIRSDGNIGIGGAGSAASTVYNTGPITGATSAFGNYILASIQSDVTATAYGFTTGITTAAASFTVSAIHHFSANANTKGAGSTITNQFGFVASASLTDATNNYGFYSAVPSGTGRWNFWAQSTAPNYFAGDVRSNTVLTARTAPANSNVTATATASSLLDGLRTGTPTANINLTLPTGTDMDAAFQELQTNQSFEWSVINLAAATHVITVVANTAHTVVGNMGVNANSSGRFITRKTAANTFITYRLA